MRILSCGDLLRKARGNFGGSGREDILLTQICIVSWSGTFNSEQGTHIKGARDFLISYLISRLLLSLGLFYVSSVLTRYHGCYFVLGAALCFRIFYLAKRARSKNRMQMNYPIPEKPEVACKRGLMALAGLKYSWTSLIWTPKGQSKVSVLERCPY